MFADDNEENYVCFWSLIQGFPSSINLVFTGHLQCARILIFLGWE